MTTCSIVQYVIGRQVICMYVNLNMTAIYSFEIVYTTNLMSISIIWRVAATQHRLIGITLFK